MNSALLGLHPENVRTMNHDNRIDNYCAVLLDHSLREIALLLIFKYVLPLGRYPITPPMRLLILSVDGVSDLPHAEYCQVRYIMLPKHLANEL
jgi:hypothetical protein